MGGDLPSLDLATDSAREVIRRSVEEYVNLVDQRTQRAAGVHSGPLGKAVQATVRTPSTEGDHAGHGRDDQQRAARDGLVERARTRRIRGVQDRRIGNRVVVGPRTRQPRAACRVEGSSWAHLTTIMMGVIVGTAEALGIAVTTLTEKKPIHDAVPNNPAVR